MIQQAIKTVRTLLPTTGSVTRSQINDAVDMILKMSVYQQVDKEALTREVESIFNVRIDNFRIIEGKERRLPWINDKKAGIDFKFWNRYRDYLQFEKNFADTVLNELDKLTDRTLDGLFDPAISGTITKYGLAVGQVQSGKTANYTGLICKAADVGFNLIIVMAGIHNNLRSQTQLRIDEGFLGFDTQHERAFRENNNWIGVSRFGQNAIAHSLTTSLSDFSSAAANASGINFGMKDPLILVVKKNANILERLLIWLSSKAIDINGKRVISNKSLLLIDDEADNASINTNRDNDPATRINDLIRNIIKLFDKGGYVGYTATPFANIFIPITEDSLFPKDFIINLPAPSNYIGPDKVFGFRPVEDDEDTDAVLPIVHRVEDHQNLLDEETLPDELPESLKTAIKCFIVTCAIRRLRGQKNVHNSMLVHVSRLRAWQHELKVLVENVFDFYRRGIEMNVSAVFEELRLIFEENQTKYKSYKTISSRIKNSGLASIDKHIQIHTWRDVKKHLHEAASRIIVKEINMSSADALNYYDHPNGLSVIAVGGNKLSRGLTLEGLSVSYYLRSSRMYDSLMQMGRWFGYRNGYVDLCRLFTTKELNEWFCHIALASEELRNEFIYMSEKTRSTPEEYALRVRTHPGVLQISASNKIRRADIVRVSWSGRLVESYELSKSPDVISANLSATINLVNALGTNFIREDNYYLWNNINADLVKQFLLGFEIHDNLKSASPQNLLRFIDIKYKNKELQSWNIGLITKKGGISFSINKDVSVNLIERTPSKESTDDLYLIRKSHIISPDDEFIDLTPEELSDAREASKQLWRKKKGVTEGEPKRLNGEYLRNKIRKPDKVLLLLYLLDHTLLETPSVSKPVVGYAISFPGTERDDAVEYAVHNQLLDKFYTQDILEEEEEDED